MYLPYCCLTLHIRYSPNLHSVQAGLHMLYKYLKDRAAFEIDSSDLSVMEPIFETALDILQSDVPHVSRI